MNESPDRPASATMPMVVVARMPNVAVVEVSGRDALDYLNRRLAQKVDTMSAGEVLPAVLLGGDGRMLAQFELLHVGERLLAVANDALGGGAELANRLGRFVFSEDASFRDVSDRLGAFAVCGEALGGVLSGAALPVPGEHEVITHEDGHLWRSALAANGVLVLVPAEAAEAMAGRLLQAARDQGGSLQGPEALEPCRIAAGIPQWGVETDEATIPLEARLYGAVHFDKGCYPGQEVLARINNLGHPARQLIAIIWEGADAPEAGTPLRWEDGSEAGRVTASARHPRHGALSLAMVPWSRREPGHVVRAGDVQGRTAALPLA